MSFVHEDAEAFEDLVSIVADDRKIPTALVEKDYWVTHTLWALKKTGFEIWFKGGTSLSKGFGIIERFSEDLDLRIDPGTVSGLKHAANWKSDGTTAVAERRAYFEALAAAIVVPDTKVELDDDAIEGDWFGMELRVTYPGRHLGELGLLVPYVRLEIGVARVTPFVERDLTSFVHEHLVKLGQLDDYDDNRPKAIRCVHPLVTLIEKLDAIQRRHGKNREPASYVRHFEDAARIVGKASELDPLDGYSGVSQLADEMFSQRQIAARPTPAAPSLTPNEGEQWEALRRAHAAIESMFWGDRIPIDQCCETLRAWIANDLA